MSRYRIVKFTFVNDNKELWSIQKLKRHWLTGRERWLYLNDSPYYAWTPNMSSAEKYYTEKSAITQLENYLQRYEESSVKVTTVKEYNV